MIIKNFIKFIKFHKTYLNVYIKVYNLIYVGVLRPPESNIKTAEITNLNPIHMNNIIYLNTHPIEIHIFWETFPKSVPSTEVIYTTKAAPLIKEWYKDSLLLASLEEYAAYSVSVSLVEILFASNISMIKQESWC